ncbi:MAG: non-homologous end-joining DNA ligase [Hyphomicrobium sp.]|uniref:non-homologous end-joining DNA ligase n=1 Tax=Hyphomicrobium sp. TaxID=82 RepID=UPI0039E582E0
MPSKIAGAVKAAMPDFIEPCLATLVAKPPTGDEWVHEIKFDGYRIQARIDKNGVRLLTRNGLDWTDRFGSLPKTLAQFHDGTAIIDGEIVVDDLSGRSSFTALAEALKSGRSDKFILHCFDLLYLDGFNLIEATLQDRKAQLEKLFARRSKAGPIRYSAHLAADGARMLADACNLGLEGIISKRIDRPYRSGRHEDWLKSKCIQVDEFVIIGYLVSSTGANAVGALVVGYYEKKQLIYAGRVGTGYTHQIASDLMRRLKPLRIDAAPVSASLTNLQRRDVVWVKPELVAQIEYRAWTADRLLRHAAFKGLREDKRAQDVRRPVVKTIKG